MKYAKDREWNNQYVSIVEGSKLIANSYINVGQNTAYFYKFDVVDEGGNGVCSHQYMTNIQDPESQSKTLYNTYASNNILDATLSFIIPVFTNMPDRCNLPSAIDQNKESSYYITGTDVIFRNQPTTTASNIGVFSKNEIVTVLELNYKQSDGYTWAKVIYANVQRSNGAKGYVANCYLKPCNQTTTGKNNNLANNNIKVDGTNVITVPNMKLSEITKKMNLTSYTITNSSGQNVDVNSNVGTGYNIKDTKENKTYKLVVLGDVNGDGKLTPADSTVILRAYVGLNKLNDIENLSVDTNRDTKLTPADSTVILRAYVGLTNINL